MFGFSKKEIFMNTDPELFFRITAALKEHGIRYETKHVNGTTVNRMTGTAASVGETLRRQTSYYAYVDQKKKDGHCCWSMHLCSIDVWDGNGFCSGTG